MKSLGPVTRIIKDLAHPQKERQLHLNLLRTFNISDELHFPEPMGDGEANDYLPSTDPDVSDDPAEVLLRSGCRVPSED